ncbi:pyridoxal phosphate-dependent transferase [Mycena floridula]|nr:pyridoxal phosphate-dependent transferase [Mycena floridula]
MDVEQFRKAGYQAVDRICNYFYSLSKGDIPVVSTVQPGYLQVLVPTTPPETGEDFQIIADDFQKLIMPGMTHWQHPSFFAYFPTACTFEGILAEMYASSVSNPGFNWSASPACTELEIIVMDWAAQMLGLSPAFYNSSGIGGGCLQTTASESAIIAIVAARSSYQKSFPDVKLEDMVIYTTTQTHSLGLKAGLVLGLRVKILEVRSEDSYSLRGHTLRLALEKDAQDGLKPFVLIATVGTTSSAAIDNISEIKDVGKYFPMNDHPYLRVHVDAAWAGVALVCPENRDRCYLDDINEFADSFTTNFHKWGLVNFDASAMWVRDRKYLTEALDFTPPYLRTHYGDTVTDFRNWHLGLGRRFRSLKLWFVLRSFGLEGFRRYIRRTIQLNERFCKLIDEDRTFRIITPPSFALTVFRLEPESSTVPHETESLNELNRIFFSRLSERNDILLSQTVLDGKNCVRFAVGSERTREQNIITAYEILKKEAELAITVWKSALYTGQ